MKILIQVTHPAHVHFYKHFIQEAKARDHDIRVIARDKDITIDLLEGLGIEYTKYMQPVSTDVLHIRRQLRSTKNTYAIARRFKPDVMTAIGGTAISWVSSVLRTPAVVFTDSEGAPLGNALTMPFANVICTPSGYEDDYGEKHIRYDGYHELAYLHPERFEPEPERLESHGINPKERFFVIRFIAWDAQHDVGQHGFSLDQKRKIVSKLDEHGTVYITSESKLPSEFEEYRLPVPPTDIHDLLYYADLYLGDSQTMATEAAVLGTPAIRSNSFAGEGDMSNFVELEEEYGLLYSTPDGEEAIQKVSEWVRDQQLAETWNRRRNRLIDDKIDVTDFMIDVIWGDK